MVYSSNFPRPLLGFLQGEEEDLLTDKTIALLGSPMQSTSVSLKTLPIISLSRYCVEVKQFNGFLHLGR